MGGEKKWGLTLGGRAISQQDSHRGWAISANS
jgi:hypothetical protein